MHIIDINKEKRILASCLPDGQFWSNKNKDGTTLGTLIYSFANVYNIYRYYADEQQQELIVFSVIKYVELWERLFGLPDEIFYNTSSLDKRIEQIIIKFIGLNCYTKPEVLNLLKILYPQIRDIKITSGSQRASFPIMFPIPFFESITQASGYCYVDIYGVKIGSTFGTGTFPIPFGEGDSSVISKILNLIKPHNIKLIINYYE